MQGEIFKVLDQSLPPQQLPTTTDLLKIRINTGSGLAHARETTREKQRTERQWRAKSAGMGRVPLARQIREVPPELALRADVKKPETGSGFWNWWCSPLLERTFLPHRRGHHGQDYIRQWELAVRKSAPAHLLTVVGSEKSAVRSPNTESNLTPDA